MTGENACWKKHGQSLRAKAISLQNWPVFLPSLLFLSEPAKPFSRKWQRADSGLQFPCLCPDGCSGTGAMSPCSVLCWAFWSQSLIVYSSFQGSAVPWVRASPGSSVSWIVRLVPRHKGNRPLVTPYVSKPCTCKPHGFRKSYTEQTLKAAACPGTPACFLLTSSDPLVT